MYRIKKINWKLDVELIEMIALIEKLKKKASREESWIG